MKISLSDDRWQVQGWVPHEWDLVGPVRLSTGNLDLSKVLHGETPPLPARVPGTIQADLARCGFIEDPYWEYNSRLCEWVSQRMWTYQRSLDVPAEAAGRRVRLRFEGIDYAARIFVNGQLAGSCEGMFLPAIFDVTEHVTPGGQNTLQVVVEPAPDSVGQVGHTTDVRTIKPRFAYKWDFTTRLIPLGIWEDAWLEIGGDQGIDEFFVHGRVEGEKAFADVRCMIDAARAGKVVADVRITLDGQPCADETFEIDAPAGLSEHARSIEIPQPRLWWPAGLGEQPIYRVELRLHDANGDGMDETAATFGLRQVEMRPNPDTPAGARDYTLTINGQAVFLKGYNWVPIEQMYGAAEEAKYEWMIRLAARSGANILRVWGGGLIEKRCFYDLCDRAGLMVWQEMPQSSSALDNEPSDDPTFVAEMRRTARIAIRRRGGHPSLVIWCAGNELTQAGQTPLLPIDESHPCLAAIGQAVSREHPNLLYIPTSPLGPSFDVNPEHIGRGVHHDVHGPWKYQGVRDHYAYFNANDCLFHGETGTDGCCSVASMERFARRETLWPCDSANRMWVHHAAWWIQGEAIAELFGPIESPTGQAADAIERFVPASQLVQAESLRYAVEANRRRQFACSATLIWQFNEPWPNFSCTSNVDYFGRPKPAYDFARQAFAPLHVSLKHDGVSVPPGQPMTGACYVHNDGEATGPAEVTWRVLDARAAVLAEGRFDATLPANGCECAGEFVYDVPAERTEAFFVELVLHVDGRAATRSEYFFCPAGDHPPLQPLLELPPARLERVEVQREEKVEPGCLAWSVTLRNAGEALAWPVRVEAASPSEAGGNGLWLAPGESRSFRVVARDEGEPAGPLQATALNADTLTIDP